MDPSVEDEFNPEEELIEVWPPEDEDPRDEQIVFVDLEGEQPEQEGQKKQQAPQEAIDEFWTKFTTKTPGKGEF